MWCDRVSKSLFKPAFCNISVIQIKFPCTVLQLVQALGQFWIADWLIDYLRFYIPLKHCSLTWRRHHCRWRAAKFWPMLGAQGLWAGRDLYRATPAVMRDLGLSGLIRTTAPFSRLLRLTRGCGGSILTRIFTECSGSQKIFYYDGC
jgi:hypothetical protein